MRVLLDDGAHEVKGSLQLSLRVVGLNGGGRNGDELALGAHVVGGGDDRDVDVCCDTKARTRR